MRTRYNRKNFTCTYPIRANSLAAESAHDKAEQAKYDLLCATKRSANKRQKLEKEVKAQGEELQRIEESAQARVRTMDMLQRVADRKQRHMDVERGILEQQQSVVFATAARLAHERKLLGAERVKMKGSLMTVEYLRQGDRTVSCVGCLRLVCVVSFHA